MHKRRLKIDNYGYFFIAPFFVGALIFVLYPMLDSFYISLTDWPGLGPKTFIGLDNYAKALQSPIFYKTIWNTLRIWLIGSLPQILIAVVLASVMNTKWFRGKGFFKVFYFLPNIVTSVFMGLLFAFIFGWQGGAVNVLLMQLNWITEPIRFASNPNSLVLICSGIIFLQWFGYQTIMVDSGMTGVPRDIYEAAEVDGASGIQTFFKITLPLIRPILLYIVVTSLIGGFKLFDVPYAIANVAGDSTKSLLSMNMYLVTTAFKQSRYGYGAALGYLYCIMILLCSVLTQRIMNKKEVGHK